MKTTIPKIILLTTSFVLGLFLRFVPSIVNNVRYFLDDDSYWHFSLEQQIIQFGHELNPDPQSWLGRIMTHPPLFHYAIAYLSILFHTSLFETAYYAPAILAFVIGFVGFFLLVRELYGDVTGIVGSSLYSVSWGVVNVASIGENRPFPISTSICIVGLWLFIKLWKKKSIWAMVPVGIVLGIASLFWEGTIYFYPPLILGTWIFWLIKGERREKTCLRFLVGMAVFTAIAAIWYAPIFYHFGIFAHSNTPASELTGSVWNQFLWSPNFGWSFVSSFFNIDMVGFLVFPLLLWKSSKEDGLPIIWFSYGLLLMFFVGLKGEQYSTIFALLLVICGAFNRLWGSEKYNLRKKVVVQLNRSVLASIVIFLLAGSAYYSYSRALMIEPNIDTYGTFFTSGVAEQTKGSTVLAWWTEGAYFETVGANVFWDLLMEHINSTDANMDKIVGCIYLSSNETFIEQQLSKYNVSYIYVSEAYLDPTALPFVSSSCGITNTLFIGTSSSDFSLSNGNGLTSQLYIPVQTTIGAYDLVPNTQASHFLYTQLLMNSSSPYPFLKLIYSQSDGDIRLWQIVNA